MPLMLQMPCCPQCFSPISTCGGFAVFNLPLLAVAEASFSMADPHGKRRGAYSFPFAAIFKLTGIRLLYSHSVPSLEVLFQSIDRKKATALHWQMLSKPLILCGCSLGAHSCFLGFLLIVSIFLPAAVSWRHPVG